MSVRCGVFIAQLDVKITTIESFPRIVHGNSLFKTLLSDILFSLSVVERIVEGDVGVLLVVDFFPDHHQTHSLRIFV